MCSEQSCRCYRAGDHERDRDKESKRLEDLEKEARKLREFLEDYDDDRDDEKYYKVRKNGRSDILHTTIVRYNNTSHFALTVRKYVLCR